MPKGKKSHTAAVFGRVNSLAAWLVTEQGRQLRSQEAQQVRAVMPRVLGYRLLQLGDWDLDLEALA
ncbi:MAG: hypothetical protein ACPHER_03420, partial [Nevskiales bacterium]